jgi:allantoate deiminase
MDAEALATQDPDGISIAQTLVAFGLDPAKIRECVVKEDVVAFLEFHIEQGIVLESEAKPLGVVHAIAGQSRAELTFTGRANHAGTTPMHLRKDAVAGAAEWVSEVERVGKDTPGMVATVGSLRPHPGAGNVIAGQVRATLDLRHADDAVRHPAVERLLASADSIAQKRGLTITSKILMDQPAVAMNPRLCAVARDAIRSLSIEPLAMVSGAGHDSMILAERVPTTMIFLRSPGGISHHPDESVLTEDVALALAAGAEFLQRFAGSYLTQAR